MTRIKPGSLKCVVLASLDDVAVGARMLAERVGDQDVRVFGSSAVLVHTVEDAGTIRDWLRGAGDVVVVEFETWSGSGSGVPREWLLARGH